MALDWPATVSEYSDRLFSAAHRIVGNDQDAEDSVQDAFIDAYRGLAHFRNDALLGTWLYRLTVNRALQRVRRRECGRVTYDEALHVRAPEGWEAARLTSQEIEDALLCLPVDYRTAVVLRDVEGLSAKEAAVVLGCNERALKSRLHRGRVLLRARLVAVE